MLNTHTIKPRNLKFKTYELLKRNHELLKCKYLSTQSLKLSILINYLLTNKIKISNYINTYLPTQNNHNKKFLRIWNNNVPNKPEENICK
jgi:hypothetical protein